MATPSFSESQNRIKGILTGEPNPSDGTAPTPAQDGDPNTEKKVDVSSEQQSESKAQETPKPNEGQSDTDKPSRRRKAKLGDKEIEFEVLTEDVDPDLIPKGLMMEWKFRQELDGISKERKGISETKSQLDQALAEAGSILSFEAERFESDEMKSLKETDPEAYWAEFNKLESKVKTYKERKAKREEELQKQYDDLVQNERSQYSQVIPEWLDDTRMSEEMTAIKKTAVQAGFSEAEAESIYDRRLVSLFRKAMLYDKIQAQDIDSKRVKDTPPKSVPSNAKNVHSPQSNKLADLKSRQRKNKGRNMKESQALIKSLLGG